MNSLSQIKRDQVAAACAALGGQWHVEDTFRFPIAGDQTAQEAALEATPGIHNGYLGTEDGIYRVFRPFTE